MFAYFGGSGDLLLMSQQPPTQQLLEESQQLILGFAWCLSCCFFALERIGFTILVSNLTTSFRLKTRHIYYASLPLS